MKPQVPVPPIGTPLAACLRVVKADDREPGPIRSILRSPRWTTFEHREVTVGDVKLVADLAPGPIGQTIIARVDPPADTGHVGLGEHRPRVGRP